MYSFVLFLFITVSALAQETRKVAVFDPAGTDDRALLEIVREEISSAVVNTSGYMVLERQLISKVLEENRFQESGLVNDEQVSDIGQLMGADYVVVSTVSVLGFNYHISCKMIEVATARINRQYTGVTTTGLNDLTAVIQSVVATMFAQKVESDENPETTLSEFLNDLTVETLQTKGVSVYAGDKKLNVKQVQLLMANTPALPVYISGKSKDQTGNILICSGIFVAASSLVLGSIVERTEYTREGDDIIGRKYNYLGVGLIGGAVGGGMAILGVKMKITGRKNIQQSIEMYKNQRQSAKDNNLSFEFKPGGVSLVFNF